MQLTIADLAETYATRAARVGVRTIHASMSDVPGAILEVAGAVGAASVAVAGNVPERGAILAAAAGRGLRLVEPAEISPVDRADLGVSVARMAVAESGSLVVHSTSADRRVELCVDVHVVLVRAEDVAASLDDALALVERLAARPPSYVSLISGPSRTADIELTLAVGVHGPRELHVILVSAG
jgi:L-lactate dehydrogenase complex protein LldG